ncbi:hypothetical protein M8J76_009494 [Diaphorina citri]|nr:hypothetical protein M8J76_009494 [Diaphorina citri]
MPCLVPTGFPDFPGPSNQIFCYKCDYSCSYKSNLINHIRRHIGEKPYKCLQCSASFIQKSALKSHYRTHTGERPYKCSHCHYSATTSSNLINHVRLKHETSNNLSIIDCCPESSRFLVVEKGSRFISGTPDVESLAFLKRLFLSFLVPSAICKERNQSAPPAAAIKSKSHDINANNATSVNRNLIPSSGNNLIPSPGNSIQCNYCLDYLLINVQAIYVHTRDCLRPARTHKYMCFACDYATYKSTNILRHIRCHLGIKLFQCNICQTSYTQKTRLDYHMQAKHVGVLENLCSQSMLICLEYWFKLNSGNRESTESLISIIFLPDGLDPKSSHSVAKKLSYPKVEQSRSTKLSCSTHIVKKLSSLNTDDKYNVYSSRESLSKTSNENSNSVEDTEHAVSDSELDEEPGNHSSRKSLDEEGEDPDTVDNEDPAANNDYDDDYREDVDETDVEVGNDDNVNKTDTEFESTKTTRSIQKKSTAIKNIFKSTLAKNKPSLKIKLKKQDIIDEDGNAGLNKTMSLRQTVPKNDKKCCFGCKDKKIISKEEPKSKVLSKLKIFNRTKYKDIVESPKASSEHPFIKRLKLRNAPPKNLDECTKVKPIKLILKRNSLDVFASKDVPPPSDVESDIENIQTPIPLTIKKSHSTKLSENDTLKDPSEVKQPSVPDTPNVEAESSVPPSSPKHLEPFDPEKEFECSDDSNSSEEESTLYTCVHCNIYGTYSKTDLINHYRTCNSLCPTVICDPVSAQDDKSQQTQKCTYCNIYTNSSKTMMRNHMKACKFKPVAQRGRPRKQKVTKEVDACKFCNFKHPDVNVFLRHLRFCNAAVQKPSTTAHTSSVTTSGTGQTTELHKCSSCNYVNTNVNIFVYHLKLCNKNYNNLSLKEMLLKYKDKPNIIGYSKPSTSSAVEICDSKNIPSSSRETSHVVNNVNTGVSNENRVQKTHVPSLFDPIDEDCTNVSDIQSSQYYPRQNTLENSANSSKVDYSLKPLNQEDQVNLLAKIKPLELSESSGSETPSYNKYHEPNSETQLLTEQIVDQTTPIEQFAGNVSTLNGVIIPEELSIGNTVTEMEIGVCPEEENSYNVEKGNCFEGPAVVESTAKNNFENMSSAMEYSYHIAGSAEENVTQTAIPQEENELSTQTDPSALEAIILETSSVLQNTTAEPPVTVVQYSLENAKEEENFNIPVETSNCVAVLPEENAVQVIAIPVEENIVETAITLDSVTPETVPEVPSSTSPTPLPLEQPQSDQTSQESLTIPEDEGPIPNTSQEVLKTNEELVSTEEEMGDMGPRRLSFEQFETIASSYYADHNKADDENDDDLIRIEPDEPKRNEGIGITDTDISKALDDLTPAIMNDEVQTDDLRTESKEVENDIENQEIEANEEKDMVNEKELDTLLFDSEDSNDAKEAELTLDVSSIHDSFLEDRVSSVVTNQMDSGDSLAQISSIPKDGSVDQDDKCSNVNSDDESEVESGSESDTSTDTVISKRPEQSEEQLCENIPVEKPCDTEENAERNLINDPSTNSRKRKVSADEDYRIEDDKVFKVPKIENNNCLPIVNKKYTNVNEKSIQANTVTSSDDNKVVFESENKIESVHETQKDEHLNSEIENVQSPKTVSDDDVAEKEGMDSNERSGESFEQPNEEIQYGEDNTRMEVTENVEESETEANKEVLDSGQNGGADSELFCSHCNHFSTFQVDELLNHFKQCTAVINEHGATPYISSEYNELAGKYDKNNCKQIINAKYTNILLNKDHGIASPSPMRSFPFNSPAAGSITPKFPRDLTGNVAESPRYMTELTSLVPSGFLDEEDQDDAEKDEPNSDDLQDL